MIHWSNPHHNDAPGPPKRTNPLLKAKSPNATNNILICIFYFKLLDDYNIRIQFPHTP